MSLKDRIITHIRATGPMPLSDYMQMCLLDPEAGYYTTKMPFGAKGDFTTSPEISQMFGEMLGLVLAQAWLDQDAPSTFVLAELGPGRGTLMADVLRATRGVPGFCDAAKIHLIEASERLRGVQGDTLSGYDVTWTASLNDLPNEPLFLLANEFFDALPIDQFVRTDAAWSRREVGIQDDDLVLGIGPDIPFAPLDPRLADTNPGDLVEYCLSAAAICREIGRRVNELGGVAIAIDYGDWRSKGDTFQAMKSHKYVDPFDAPGTADLTAHVDFEALATALSDASVTQMSTQGVLLERLGITARANALAARMRGDDLSSHIEAHRRLTHPDEMGNLFKAIAAYPNGGPVPPGFEK